MAYFCACLCWLKIQHRLCSTERQVEDTMEPLYLNCSGPSPVRLLAIRSFFKYPGLLQYSLNNGYKMLLWELYAECCFESVLTNVITIVRSIILLCLSILHGYWAFGNYKWHRYKVWGYEQGYWPGGTRISVTWNPVKGIRQWEGRTPWNQKMALLMHLKKREREISEQEKPPFS